jgi:transcriptional regulator with XRE-family HTH domain
VFDFTKIGVDDLNSPKEMAKLIRELLKKRGKTAKEMLAQLGMSKDTIGTMSAGNMPIVDRLCKIADYLGCSMDYLTGRVPEQKSSDAEASEGHLLEQYRQLDKDEQNELYKYLYARNHIGEMITSVFVVTPLGDIGSNTRKLADKIYKNIITIACSGFTSCQLPLRSDMYRNSNSVTQEIRDDLNSADIVIIVLFEDSEDINTKSKDNPNVYWEFGWRAATNKPFVVLRENNYKTPFDVADTRNIEYSKNIVLQDEDATNGKIVNELAETMRQNFCEYAAKLKDIILLKHEPKMSVTKIFRRKVKEGGEVHSNKFGEYVKEIRGELPREDFLEEIGLIFPPWHTEAEDLSKKTIGEIFIGTLESEDGPDKIIVTREAVMQFCRISNTPERKGRLQRYTDIAILIERDGYPDFTAYNEEVCKCIYDKVVEISVEKSKDIADIFTDAEINGYVPGGDMEFTAEMVRRLCDVTEKPPKYFTGLPIDDVIAEADNDSITIDDVTTNVDATANSPAAKEITLSDVNTTLLGIAEMLKQIGENMATMQEQMANMQEQMAQMATKDDVEKLDVRLKALEPAEEKTI